MPHCLVIPIIRRPHYSVGFEQFDHCTYVHVDVSKWSPGIAKNFLADIATLRELHGGPFYAFGLDDKQIKFLRLSGFYPFDTARTIDGLERPLYRKD